MMARKCIEKYLETHKSTYIGRYRCHSAVQTKKFEHKFHYYILDIQFKAIDVFVKIFNPLAFSFSTICLANF